MGDVNFCYGKFWPIGLLFFSAIYLLFFGSELLKKDTATTTQKRITDIFCWLTFSFVAWKFHESIRVIFHGLSLVNMLLLSDASRVPEKTTSNQPPPRTRRGTAEKNSTYLSCSERFLGTSYQSLRKRC